MRDNPGNLFFIYAPRTDPNNNYSETSIKPRSRHGQAPAKGDIITQILSNSKVDFDSLTKEQVGKLFHKQKEVLLSAENRVLANRKDMALVQERYAKMASECQSDPKKIEEYKPMAVQLKECYTQLNSRLQDSVDKYKQIHQKVEILQDLYLKLKVRDKELHGSLGGLVLIEA